MLRLEQVRPAMLRLGSNAESAYMANKPFSLTLEFPTLGSALAFRLDFYRTRKFLNHLRDRNKPEILPLLSALSGLNRLSCARCDREPALRHLNDFGYVPLYFSLSAATYTDIDSQLDSLGLDAYDNSNVATLRHSDFPTATPSAPATAPATATPSPTLHISEPTLPASFHILGYECTPSDFNLHSMHEAAYRFVDYYTSWLANPNELNTANVRRTLRKLLTSEAVSMTLRNHLTQTVPTTLLD